MWESTFRATDPTTCRESECVASCVCLPKMKKMLKLDALISSLGRIVEGLMLTSILVMSPNMCCSALT